ncbi:unnamed protein product [Leuciscus chuanchicus]
MPSEVQSAIANSTRPNPAARRAMVRSLVDQMRGHNSNPKRGICAQVANDIVRKYPQCFGDVNGDDNVAAASLLQQLKTRIEHVNRNNTMARLRQKRPSIPGVRSQERGPMDQYGCVRWQPEELPAGETEESLQEMKKQMLQLYAQVGMAGAERGGLQRWHENTYILQRRDLNADPSPSISKIKDDWPFLFSLKGLFSHFSELTGISILEKLPAAIEQRSKTIIEYFKQHKTTGVEQLQSKVYDLENRGRRKNLRIVGVPEGVEGSGPLTTFLRSSIPKWLDLPADSLALDIERAHRSPTFAPSNVNLNSSPRSVLIRFLRFTEKETVLRAALKKTINHEGAELRFYSDLSTSVLQKRREFSSVVKTMASRGLYRGFAYPARLRCLHMGKIRLFDDPNSAKAFLDSLDR